MNEQNELKHYGVLGMKWGIHKAEQRGETYRYKSHGQKKWEKKRDKALKSGSDARLAKAEGKLERFQIRDEVRERFARNTKTGYAIARGLLMGVFGTSTYNRLRAAGSGRYGVWPKIKTGVISILAGPLGMLPSYTAERNRATKKYFDYRDYDEHKRQNNSEKKSSRTWHV